MFGHRRASGKPRHPATEQLPGGARERGDAGPGPVPVLGGAEPDSRDFIMGPPGGAQSGTRELFISGTFLWIFSDPG